MNDEVAASQPHVDTLALDVAAVAGIDAVQKILEVICRTTGMGFSAIARVTEARWVACAVRDEIAFGLKPGGELALTSTICDEIRRSGQPVVIDDVANDALFCGHPTPALYGFQSYLSVPIRLPDGKFFGTLCAIDPRPAKVNTPETIGMFKLFADLVGQHLDAERRAADERSSAASSRAERELLRTVFDHASDDAIVVMDAERVVTAWNPAAERITGWTAAEAIGQTADTFFTAADQSASEPARRVRRVAAEDRSAEEGWLARKDGSRFWGSGTLNVLRDSAGTVSGFLKVFRDATDRHEQDRTLAFLDQMTDALIAERDPDRVISRVERLLCEHLGASRVVLAEGVADGLHTVVRHEYAPGLPSIVGRHRIEDFGSKVAAAYRARQVHLSTDVRQNYAAGDGMEAHLSIGAVAGVSIPVVLSDGLTALFVVHQTSARAWTEAEVVLIRQVAERMAGVLERARAEAAVRASEARQAYLVRLGDALRPVSDPVDVQAVACRVLGEHLEAGRVAYFEITGDDYAVERDYTAGTRSLAGRKPVAAFGQGILDRLTDGQTAVEEDAPATLARSAAERAVFAEWQIAALVTVPLVKSGAFVAGLTVHAPARRAWTTEEVSLIEETAERTWAAVEQSRSDRALARSERQRRLAVEAGGVGSFNIDPTTGTFETDARFRTIFCGTGDCAMGYEQAFACIHPDDREGVRERVAAAIDPARSEPYAYEYRVIHPEGSTVWVSAQGRAVFDGEELNRQAVSFDGTIIDVTDRKRAEAERDHLLEAERSARTDAELAGRIKDEFLATLSHELRTPLNAIVGWTQILSAPGQRPEDYAEGLAVIDRNARAQTQIIEDILDMSRIISGKLRLDVQRVDLAGLVKAGVDTVQPAADAKRVRLQVLLDPLVGPIAGDPNRLHQVFWNLLSNAVKFTPGGGKVQVVLERINSHLEVSVTDTGEGIDPSFLPHVFDRFRQADASTTRRHGGLGLGLAIVKQLVELHGGQVRVKSLGKGAGATFVVALPVSIVRPDSEEPTKLREHPASSVQSDDRPTACGQLVGVTVVAVDDEPDGVAVVERLLAACGAVVRTATSAAEALDLIRAEVPAVLVSDIGMPGEDGYALIRQVRALPPEAGGRVRALALTAYARAEDRIKALQAGFQMHLSKPVEPAELIVTIAALVGSSTL